MNGLISRSDMHPALVRPGQAPEEAIRYGELEELVDGLARQLAATGLASGDRLAMVIPNGPEFVIGFLAAIRCGAAAAPLNPQYTAHEFADYLADIRPRAVLYLKESLPAASAAAASLGISEWHLETEKSHRLRVRQATCRFLGAPPHRGLGGAASSHQRDHRQAKGGAIATVESSARRRHRRSQLQARAART